MSCAAAQKFFSVLGLDRKFLELGVLGLKYHVLGIKKLWLVTSQTGPK